MAALDFKRMLDAVASPDRDRIWHLTNLARDNVEEAASIAKVIESDIKSTRPQRKLVPFYVLDSIVKNVGSPYNIYFGFALYASFFDAYSQVDGGTRKSMEGMLRTWKQPVPNTLETDPVFAPNITGPIEKALQTAQQNAQMKTQTAYMQDPHHLQQRFPRQPHALPPRPPDHTPWLAQTQYIQPQTNGYHSLQQFPKPRVPVPSSTYPMQQQTIAPTEQHALLTDVDKLLKMMQGQLTTSPWNTELRGKVDNVVQLQHVLHTQQLPFEQWISIQTLISSLLSEHDRVNAEPTPAYDRPSSVTQNPYLRPPVLSHQQCQTPRPPSSHVHQPSQIQQPVTFDTGILAALAASLDAQQGVVSQSAPRTSKPRPESSDFQDVHGGRGAIPASNNSSVDLNGISGLYHRIFTPNQAQDKGLPSVYRPPPGPGPLPNAKESHMISGVKLESSMLKDARPELYRALWQHRSLCRTCGRRFPSTVDGKARKARHLDYHFRSNMRRQDASRGAAVATRSWFMDEAEWIKFREVDEADEAPDIVSDRDKPHVGQNKQSNGLLNQESYVRIPGDRDSINAVCPICQEGFKDTWQAELQDWVWPDCMRGKDGRYFHASCIESYKEDEIAAKDREANLRDAVDTELESKTFEVVSNVKRHVDKDAEMVSEELSGRKRKAEALEA